MAPEGCQPYDQALNAIREADAIVLGPGSLFTSVIANLLVPGVIDAVRDSHAVRIFPCNVSDMDGETKGMRAEDHVQALIDHGMDGLIDFAIVHADGPLLPEADLMAHLDALPANVTRPVALSVEGAQRIRDHGIRLISRPLSSTGRPEWHDPLALRSALMEVFEACPSLPM
jgi:uncharacterized cofD-like protein